MLMPLLFLVAADPIPLQSRIEDVTLYASSALVHRSTRVTASGTFVIQGLPLTLERDNVRVRCAGGDVLSVEVRDRQQQGTPNDRLQGLRERLTVLGRDLQAARDDVRIVEAMQKHLVNLSSVDAKDYHDDLAAKRSDSNGWNLSFAFLQGKLAENAKASREATWKAQDVERAYQQLEAEIGRLATDGNVSVRDVVVEVETRGEAALDLEYMVSGTGWAPYYDLRAASDLASVELGYRARIVQRSGEDWNDVAVSLSTAQPQRGAQGPEPVPQWISVIEHGEYPASVGFQSSNKEVMSDDGSAGDFRAVKAEVQENQAPPPFATVQSQGLSVRFALARRETIQSREQPTTVLIGRASLASAPERFCTPALDPTVWLRGKAKNTSAWTILPGDAAVFLGADYLGLAHLDAVQPGQEFTLHLGADPALVVKRTQTEDMNKGPSFLASRAKKIEGWRVHLENHGAKSLDKDGSVEVIVREVLPRSRDERVDVELTKSEPKDSRDDRWKQDLDENGIHTWIVRVPRNGASDVVWQTTITYPKGAELVRQ